MVDGVAVEGSVSYSHDPVTMSSCGDPCADHENAYADDAADADDGRHGRSCDPRSGHDRET